MNFFTAASEHTLTYTPSAVLTHLIVAPQLRIGRQPSSYSISQFLTRSFALVQALLQLLTHKLRAGFSDGRQTCGCGWSHSTCSAGGASAILCSAGALPCCV